MEEATLLTVKEAAEKLGLTLSAVYQAMNNGALPFVEVLGKRGIRPQDLARYLPRAYGDRPGRKVGGRPRKVIHNSERVEINQTPTLSHGSKQGVRAKYPQGLVEEYQELALKRLEVPLSVEEQDRLQELKQMISAIDRQSATLEAMHKECDKIEAELEAIRFNAEALLRTKQQGY